MRNKVYFVRDFMIGRLGRGKGYYWSYLGCALKRSNPEQAGSRSRGGAPEGGPPVDSRMPRREPLR